MQPPINPSSQSSEQKDALILQLFEQIGKLSAEIQDLRSQLSKNSRNSSKPPSSDGYGKPKPKSRRTKSGKSSGGQKGHKGNMLKQVEHPDQVVDCCAPHSNHTLSQIIRQSIRHYIRLIPTLTS